ncbi:MAG: hypothetical protein ACRYFS_15980 [Janthinobacterium lividum]
MKTTHKIISLTAAVLAVGASFTIMPSVRAETLTFNDASASSAAAAMNQRYGVTIVFRGSIDTSRPVSFSVDNPDTPDGRLQAVSSLASALGLDFQKVFVVSKADLGVAPSKVKLDSDGPIVFTSTHVSARQAIQSIAAVDNALTQISSSVDGDVTLPGTHMSITDAATVISKQTGTQWKAYYGLFQRGNEPQRFSGAVIDRTNGGQPITELPLLTYRNTISVPAQLHSGQDAVVGPFAAISSDPTVASVPNTNFGGFVPDTSGFGYGDPYGYTNPYGYTAPDGSIATPGAVYTPGAGVAPVVPGVNAPPANTGAGTTTVLPSFPYMGSVGGDTTVGGY